MLLSKLVSLGLTPMALSAEGAASTFDVSTVMKDAVSTTQGQLFTVLGIVVPAIVAVAAAVVGIKFGIKWLRNLKG